MECRSGCGACCIAPSINTPLPGMPQGKPAGVMCVNLGVDSRRCKLWGQTNYPALCSDFAAGINVCGDSGDEAMQLITLLEQQTR